MDSSPPAPCVDGAASAHWLDLLRRNVGFDDPEAWLDYARSHGFRDVRATPLRTCPSCAEPSSRVIGQYVYYSTLFRLRACRGCGLAYADVRLADEVVRAHFEIAYKDDTYFREQRAKIFDHLARLVGERAFPGASVLDVGGATGHLLSAIRARRPDLRLALSDISQAACDAAALKHGFRTICGGLAALEGCADDFDVVVMSDVLYYEPDLPAVWRLLPRLVAPGGSVIVRVPNRLPWIRIGTLLSRWRPGTAPAQATHIPFFNPEHLYAFSRGYLLNRLRTSGFVDVGALPTPLLVRATSRLPAHAFHAAARAVHALSGGRVITPAMVLVGRRP